MKKYILTMVMVFAAITIFAQDAMRKTADGTYIVNTTTLCNARGYRAATPVEVYIKDGKVLKVTTLRNQETRSFFDRVKQHLLPLFSDKKIAQAKKLTSKQNIDGCTGATISTRAVQANIKAALDYYKKHK